MKYRWIFILLILSKSPPLTITFYHDLL